MRYPQAIVVALLFLAGTDGALARTTSDWNEVAAQLALMPDQCRTGPTFGITDGPIEEAAAALGRALAPAAGAPKTWKIVRLEDPHIDSFTRDTIIFETNDGGTVVSYHFYDALGVLRSALDEWPSGCAELIAASVAPADGHGEIAGPVHVQTRRFDVMHYLDNRGSHPDKVIVHIDDAAIDLSPSPNHGLHVSGVITQHDAARDYPDKDINRPATERTENDLNFDPRFQVYMTREQSKDIFDWQIDDGRWHGQQISATLSPEDRERARTFFARGFDMYKTGDLVGARTFLVGGLKIDPGNHVGWFTLGEIARSSLITAQGSDRNMFRRYLRIYYRHVIDLAPDSPEALLAKGYLDADH